MDVVPHQDAVLIRASAGTGKTFQLSTRLLQLLVTGQSVDRILATTFTRKAAGEILDRVLERLAAAIENPKKLTELNSSLIDVQLTQADCQSLLKKLTAQLHRLRISTLDSFFSQLARAYAYELKLPGGWQLMDPQRENSIRQQAIQALLDQHDRRQLRTMLNLLGKGEYSAGILREIERTVENGASLAGITDPKAWENPTVPQGVGDSHLEMAIHSLQPNDEFKISLNKALTKLQTQIIGSDWESIASSTLIQATNSPEPTFSRAKIPESVVDALLVVRKQAVHIALSVYRNQTTSSRDLLSYYLNYLDVQKRQIREWTFDDVSRKLAQWLNEDGLNTESLGFRLDFAIDHLLLDEFQDTSLIQWEVLYPFVKSIDRRRKQDHCSFFCVGDTKQAIYGWRGGIAELFDEVGKQLPDLRTQFLTDSRRSSPIVLRAVNQVFSNLDQHEAYGKGAVEAAKWLSAFNPHTAHHEEMVGYVQLYQGTANKELTSKERELALFTKAAEDVAEIARKNPQGSIGILVRTNDEVGLVIDLLRKYKLDVSQEGGNPLTDSAAVEVILSLLMIADHPGHSVSVWHLRHSPLACQFDAALLENPGDLSLRLRHELAELGLAKFLIKYCNMLAEACNERDQLRLEQLIQQAFSFSMQSHSRVLAFIDHIRRQKVALPQPAQVRVMNIHQSKGLEFDSVFLPNLNDSMAGQTPLFVAMRNSPTERPSGVVRYMNSNLQSMLDDDWQEAFRRDAGLRISESLCILYVAMTRAKYALYMYITPGKAEQKSTMGSLLQSTLVEESQLTSEDSVTYQIGKPDWYSGLVSETTEKLKKKTDKQPTLFDGVETKRTPNKAKQETLKRGKKMFISAQKRRHIESAVSPSRLVHDVGAPLSWSDQVKAPETVGDIFGVQVATAALEGSVEHAWLAKLRWLANMKELEEEKWEIAAAAIDRSHWGMLDIEELWRRFSKHFEHAKIQDLFRTKRYAKQVGSSGLLQVENEMRFATLLNGRLIQGSIDRLVLSLDHEQATFAEVIDFKTDRFGGRESQKEWVREQVEKYRPQLAAYAEVVAKTYRLTKAQIRTTLVLLDVGEVADASDRAE